MSGEMRIPRKCISKCSIVSAHFLLQANQDPSLNEEIIRHQLYLIDLEEERMKLL